MRFCAYIPTPRLLTFFFLTFVILISSAESLYEERFGGDRNIFTVSMYSGRMMAKGVQVACVIDCTALDLAAFEIPSDGRVVRYFHNTNEWDDFDVEYHHLPPASDVVDPEGGDAVGTVPPDSAIEKFLSICASSLKSRPNGHIAIFDSRGGLGVASYLAALYMCERLRAPVHVALASLREAMKPCGLADADLARDLQRRYKGRREIKIENIPSWWWAVEDDDENDEDDQEEEDGGVDEVPNGGRKKRGRDLTVVIPPFDQIGSKGGQNFGDGDEGGLAKKRLRLGADPDTDASAAAGSGSPRPQIPGLQPQTPDSPRYKRAVTVLRQLTGRPCLPGIPMGTESPLTSGTKLTHLKYKVTWRSRGRRGMILILSEGVYFLENGVSQIDVFLVKGGMHFPQPKNLSQPQHRSLLDGILVADREGQVIVPRYYATDILFHMGGKLTSKPFGQRIKYLMDGVIMARKKDARYDYRREPIKIRAKEYFDTGKLAFVLKDVTRGVAHETDGVVFVPSEGKYYATDGSEADTSLFWKRGDEMSEEELVRTISTI